jgi:hypothetical protein
MRAHLVVVFLVVLGVSGHGAWGDVRSSAQEMGPTTKCMQDFPSATSPDPRATVIVCRLDNPRGLTLGPEGALYIAEAGRGGTGPCIVGLMTFCYGPSGAVSRLWHGTVERLLTGLPSLARFPDGFRATGPNDVAMLGRGTGHVTIGLENDPAFRDTQPEYSGLGRLVRFTPEGVWHFTADIAAYEAAHNPDGRIDFERCPGDPEPCPYLDSNPYGLLAVPGGPLVTDAGANALLRVAANGELSVMAVFHSRGTDPPRASGALPPSDPLTDAVPTTVVKGPDGAYYVAELTGVPFVAGKANIYRVVAGEAPPVFLTSDACISGFKMIIDMDFDAQGNLYVLQHATGATGQGGPGVLIRVAPDMTKSDACSQYAHGVRTTVVTGLTRPTSVLAAPDGALYISNRGNTAGGGQVIRIQP